MWLNVSKTLHEYKEKNGPQSRVNRGCEYYTG